MAPPTVKGEAGAAKDPRDTHPAQYLGGHVINVVSRLPTSVKQAPDGALVREVCFFSGDLTLTII